MGAGIDFTCFEADSDVCGFWRYKPDSKFPSVYKAVSEEKRKKETEREREKRRIEEWRKVHIDSDRDMTSFGDCPISPSEPVFLPHTRVYDYLKKNIQECGLAEKIQLNTRVVKVSPLPLQAGQKMCRWRVEYTQNGSEVRHEDFDGVMIAVGRHGGGAYAPKFPGLESFTGTVMHSRWEYMY